ncbi:DUF6328 family protein [Mycobacterium sp. SMC-4]|uniref:DUF6328 family protein n=1 Tax=Mycobacterium sp. SMC-4 TaxID=2857059 RepID=UPI0021B2A19C|nr:DUF6328 family protein [Mycobacterium sp. SMC-4]UXA17104.1 hypothetical protein KXD98_20500 [Mycobacterium sp. SMC-4]
MAGVPDDEDQQLYRGRRETRTERLDRQWNSLLQELRVVQTGVQVLTGFLLMLPFQSRFDILSGPMRVVYLFTVCTAVVSTALLVAPVAMHRVLFRRQKLDSLVSASHVCAYAGVLLLGLSVVGMTVVVFYAVVGSVPALVAGGCALVVFSAFWLLLPLEMRRSQQPTP